MAASTNYYHGIGMLNDFDLDRLLTASGPGTGNAYSEELFGMSQRAIDDANERRLAELERTFRLDQEAADRQQELQALALEQRYRDTLRTIQNTPNNPRWGDQMTAAEQKFKNDNSNLILQTKMAKANRALQQHRLESDEQALARAAKQDITQAWNQGRLPWQQVQRKAQAQAKAESQPESYAPTTQATQTAKPSARAERATLQPQIDPFEPDTSFGDQIARDIAVRQRATLPPSVAPQAQRIEEEGRMNMEAAAKRQADMQKQGDYVASEQSRRSEQAGAQANQDSWANPEVRAAASRQTGKVERPRNVVPNNYEDRADYSTVGQRPTPTFLGEMGPTAEQIAANNAAAQARLERSMGIGGGPPVGSRYVAGAGWTTGREVADPFEALRAGPVDTAEAFARGQIPAQTWQANNRAFIDSQRDVTALRAQQDRERRAFENWRTGAISSQRWGGNDQPESNKTGPQLPRW